MIADKLRFNRSCTCGQGMELESNILKIPECRSEDQALELAFWFYRFDILFNLIKGNCGFTYLMFSLNFVPLKEVLGKICQW